MKYVISQLPIYIRGQKRRWGARFLLLFGLLIVFQLALYSYLFHVIMLYEGQHHSGLTGLYWTLTVMTTLGFGDITFASDLGKLFSILVLLSGITFFMLMLPFTFIRFIYQPWIESRSKTRVPTAVDPEARRHVVLAGFDMISQNIIERLAQYRVPYVALVPDSEQALSLIDRGYAVVLGEFDDPRTYERLQVSNAALVAALCDDMKNTNIASTVREVSPDVPILSSVNSEDSVDILELAGANHVFNFTKMLGRAFARRAMDAVMPASTIARFDEMAIAELSSNRTGLVGKTVAESRFRATTGLNIVGIWERNRFIPPGPDTVIAAGAALLIAGSIGRIEAFERNLPRPEARAKAPVLVIGCGRVGKAVVAAMEERGANFKVVEQDPRQIPSDDPRYLLGSAADLGVLEAAGIRTTTSVLVTTHSDDLNIYLTIYCRRLRPDIKIISRASLDRNIHSLYSAGANVVMSHASMAANAVLNLLTPNKVFMLTEGLDIFKVTVPPALMGKSLIESKMRQETGCNVIAMRSGGKLMTPPDPTRLFAAGDELILIGSSEAQSAFMQRYITPPGIGPGGSRRSFWR